MVVLGDIFNLNSTLGVFKEVTKKFGVELFGNRCRVREEVRRD
jgi:hypothetical protein